MSSQSNARPAAGDAGLDDQFLGFGEMLGMDSSSTNVSLLSRIRDRANDAAWREFDGRYRELMLRYCRRRGLTQVDAEDVVQSTFAGLSDSLPRFTYDANRGRFRDYLYRCIRNEISRWAARPQTAGRTLFTDGGPAAAADRVDTAAAEIDALWEEEWVAHHYRRALATIRETFDPRNVEMFDRSISGANVELVAVEFGMTVQAVYKARKRIRDRMEELIAEQIREEDDVDGESRA